MKNQIWVKLLSLGLLICLFLTACSESWGLPVTAAYAAVEEELGKGQAVAMVLYERESEEFENAMNLGLYGEEVIILPRFVGSKVELFRISAQGSDSFRMAEKPHHIVDVDTETVIRFHVSDLGPNRMWYLQTTLPDGQCWGTPLPYFCERDRETVYVGKKWDGKELLPENWGEEEIMTEAKPVIYLYPEERQKVQVELDYDGELSCTYPKYKDGWSVTAEPDGLLTDAQGKQYSYLYWEGKRETEYDFSAGFCVPGEDTAAFLEGALETLGLNRREANEFIVYWLPLMEQNPYNVISFQKENYEEAAKLRISPEPDSMIRVFMAWYGSQLPVDLPTQELITADRQGFTVVEWGGAEAARR